MFSLVRDLPGGEEMVRLAEALAAARNASDLPAIAGLGGE